MPTPPAPGAPTTSRKPSSVSSPCRTPPKPAFSLASGAVSDSGAAVQVPSSARVKKKTAPARFTLPTAVPGAPIAATRPSVIIAAPKPSPSAASGDSTTPASFQAEPSHSKR